MILEVKNLYKNFETVAGSEPIEVLKDLNMGMEVGESVAILGQSGSGKSTLLTLLAGLDSPSSGEILLNEQDMQQLNEEELSKFRAQNIGIIFQQFHLMSHLTALENVSLPLDLFKDKASIEKAQEALEQVGLGHRMDHFPYQLSGGECQRVAIARAMVVRPSILLADEPTGNLDSATGEHISDMIFELVEKHKMTLLFVTHNEKLALRCGRQLRLQGGKFI
ncbi:ABC transporter ATP-binding protein [Haliea sp. AH-315-K21]|uniref:ABC transporter ATP-binding protein n=1 Tax=SAR86 cluster bacterium TaxID=2030880 RepID=A0A2A5CA67_9GAMM|nr:ABC transporter ATP-binding protein [Haliea sp. AH-315-K21]PCJ40702.1 MAG: ABC transporter ATP-binding protein [SAR86 cluster bacterium]